MQITLGNVIDIIMAFCFIFAVVRGWQTGLIIKLAHLAAIVASGFLAYTAGNLCTGNIGMRYLVSSICFFVAVIVLYQVIRLLHIVDYVPILGKLNKAGGALVGFLTEFLFFYVICMVCFQLIPQSLWNQWGLTQDVVSNTWILQAFVKR